MKRRMIIGATFVTLICICIALNTKVIDPADYTGAWYRVSDGMLFLFEDGIIECAEKDVIVLDNAAFSGAYSIAKDKAAIFVVDDNGVGEVVVLNLVHKFDGDILCEYKDGDEIVWFCRNRDS